MRRNWIFLALLLSVGVNCGLLGMAVVRHRLAATLERGDRPPGRDGARLADRLELKEDVREQFMKLQRELAERVRDGRRKIDAGRRELRRELTSPEPDRARIEELLLAIDREQNALDQALVENVLAARELLDGPAEREYLRFVERFGGALNGPRPPGLRPGLPPDSRPPRFGGRKLRDRPGPP